jgi:hypothetical protein
MSKREAAWQGTQAVAAAEALSLARQRQMGEWQASRTRAASQQCRRSARAHSQARLSAVYKTLILIGVVLILLTSDLHSEPRLALSESLLEE